MTPKIKPIFNFKDLKERAKRDLLESSAACDIFEKDDEATVDRIAEWYAAGVARGLEIALTNLLEWIK